MKVFCYFVEPASYTLDLAKNVYDKNNIDYCFIKTTSLVQSDEKSDKVFLDKKLLLIPSNELINSIIFDSQLPVS